MSGHPSLSKSAAAAPIPYEPLACQLALDEHHGGGAARPRDAGRLRDVGERAVAAIPVEDVRAADEAERPARHGDLVVPAVGRGPGLRRARLDRTAGNWPRTDPGGHRGRSRGTRTRLPTWPRARHTSLLRDIGERAVTVVVIQHVAAPAGDEEIVEAVVVVVADATGLAPAGVRQPGLRRDVGERAVAVVVKEVARGPVGADGRIEAGGVHQEDVEPAVAIVVEERGAAAHLLEQELLVGRAARDVLRLQQARGRRDVREEHRRAGVLASRRGREPRRERRCRASPGQPEEPTPRGPAFTAVHAAVPTEWQACRPRPGRADVCRARPTRDPGA